MTPAHRKHLIEAARELGALGSKVSPHDISKMGKLFYDGMEVLYNDARESAPWLILAVALAGGGIAMLRLGQKSDALVKPDDVIRSDDPEPREPPKTPEERGIDELALHRARTDAQIVTTKEQLVTNFSNIDLSTDLVEVSAFAPPVAPADEEVLVQVYLHKIDQAGLVEQLTKNADEKTARRDVATLATKVGHGQRVDVELNALGLTVNPPAQFVVWLGEPTACRFQLKFPPGAAGRSYSVWVRVILNSVPIGHLAFKLRAESSGCSWAARCVGESARRYQYAFLSYASPDLPAALLTAQHLKAVHIDFFQDKLSLEPGAPYEPQLFKEIDRCDLFMLHWSSHAAASVWVIREAEYALERGRKSEPNGVPHIRPIVLENPVPDPPDSLKHLHFDDPIFRLIASLETEAAPVVPHSVLKLSPDGGVAKPVGKDCMGTGRDVG
jgi:hypothetical protein